jgi:3' exoribonuclease, RNase T-like
MHVMLDLETLGTKPGCAIVSIGACVFNAEGVQEKLYRPIDITKKIAQGHLAMDPGTIVWWMGQSAEARAAFTDQNRVSTYDAITDFRNWWVDMELKHLPESYLWCHGATFDAPILEAVYNSIGHQAPFKFYNVRDTRTLYALAGVYPDRNKGTHHNALDDAVSQAEAAIKAYAALGKAL